jgi:hypothetical protein
VAVWGGGGKGEGNNTIYRVVLRGDYPGSQFCLGTMQARVALRKWDMASSPWDVPRRMRRDKSRSTGRRATWSGQVGTTCSMVWRAAPQGQSTGWSAWNRAEYAPTKAWVMNLTSVEKMAPAALRTHDNGRGLAGWGRREGGQCRPGRFGRCLASAPFVDNIGLDGASLVADGVWFAVVWREGAWGDGVGEMACTGETD